MQPGGLVLAVMGRAWFGRPVPSPNPARRATQPGALGPRCRVPSQTCLSRRRFRSADAGAQALPRCWALDLTPPITLSQGLIPQPRAQAPLHRQALRHCRAAAHAPCWVPAAAFPMGGWPAAPRWHCAQAAAAACPAIRRRAAGTGSVRAAGPSGASRRTPCIAAANLVTVVARLCCKACRVRLCSTVHTLHSRLHTCDYKCHPGATGAAHRQKSTAPGPRSTIRVWLIHNGPQSTIHIKPKLGFWVWCQSTSHSKLRFPHTQELHRTGGGRVRARARASPAPRRASARRRRPQMRPAAPATRTAMRPARPPAPGPPLRSSAAAQGAARPGKTFIRAASLNETGMAEAGAGSSVCQLRTRNTSWA